MAGHTGIVPGELVLEILVEGELNGHVADARKGRDYSTAAYEPDEEEHRQVRDVWKGARITDSAHIQGQRQGKNYQSRQQPSCLWGARSRFKHHESL